MRGAGFFLAAFIAASAQAQTAHSSDGLDVGVRYWLSTGNLKHSIDATSADPTLIHPLAESLLSPTATQHFDQLSASTVELFARKRIEDRFFVKGTAGLGNINSGSLTDETFFVVGGEPVHTQSLSATDGKLGYATLDVGRIFTQTRESAFGMFVGYHYWTEKVDAHGFSDVFGTNSLPPSTLVLTNEVTWHAVRLGGEYRATHGRTRVVIEAAWLPYAGYSNDVSQPLNPAFAPHTKGNGRGGTFDAEVRRIFPQLGGIEAAVGLRYWALSAYNGTETLSTFSFPVVDLSTERYGVTFTLAKNW